MFHMTLQYSMQLLDELPMIYTTCLFIYLQAMIKEGQKNLLKLLKGIVVNIYVTKDGNAGCPIDKGTL